MADVVGGARSPTMGGGGIDIARMDRALRDFRHGIIAFEGMEPLPEAKYLLPPAGLTDPTVILRALFDNLAWGLTPPDVVFKADELFYAGSGKNGGYFMQNGDGPPMEADWEWARGEWNHILGEGSTGLQSGSSFLSGTVNLKQSVPRRHRDRMSSVAQSCHDTCSKLDLVPWFYSGTPCMGGGDGGNLFTDYLQRATNLPVFLGVAGPEHDLFDEQVPEGVLVPNHATSMFLQSKGAKMGNRSANPSSNARMPFVLQACPELDLQHCAVRLRDAPRSKFLYPNMLKHLLGDQASNKRWLNPGVTHYVFFRKSQDGLYRSFRSLVETRLAATVRIVVGPCNTPLFAESIFDQTRAQRSALALVLDKSAPLASRIAAGMRSRDGLDEETTDDRPLPDMWPITIPSALSEDQIRAVPFLQDMRDCDFRLRLSDELLKVLPLLVQKERGEFEEVTAECHLKLEAVWKLATRLYVAADRSGRGRDLLTSLTILVMVVTFAVGALYIFDRRLSGDSCETFESSSHWAHTVYVYLCRYHRYLITVNGILPLVAMASLVRSLTPLVLAQDAPSCYLRSSAAQLVREIYTCRCGVGMYELPRSTWTRMASPSPPLIEDASNGSVTTPAATLEERLGDVARQVLETTGIVVDSLPEPRESEVILYKASVIGASPSQVPTVENSGSGTALLGTYSDCLLDADDGTSSLRLADYIHLRVHGSLQRLQRQRRKQKCYSRLCWLWAIANTMAVVAFGVYQMYQAQLLCMIVLMATVALIDVGDLPRCIRHIGQMLNVLGDYLEQWWSFSEAEQRLPSFFKSIVDAVEDVLMLEGSHSADDSVSHDACTLCDGRLAAPPSAKPRSCFGGDAESAGVPVSPVQRSAGPRLGAPLPVGHAGRARIH